MTDEVENYELEEELDLELEEELEETEDLQDVVDSANEALEDEVDELTELETELAKVNANGGPTAKLKNQIRAIKEGK